MRITREALYDAIWTEPMTTVAKRFDVSSNYLARICARLGVPRPTRGYWQQLAAGECVKKPALPAPEAGMELEWTRDGSSPATQPIASVTPGPASERAHKRSIHPVLAGAAAHFAHSRETRAEYYVRPFKQNLVDIFVSNKALLTALGVANALYRYLQRSGMRVTLSPNNALRHVRCERREGDPGRDDYDFTGWQPAKPTVTFVGDVAFGLTVFEIAEEVPVRYDGTSRAWVRLLAQPPRGRTRRASPGHDWSTKKWMPTGRFGVHAYAPYGGVEWSRYWRESAVGSLRRHFEDIAATLTEAAPTIVSLIDVEKQRAAEEQRKWELQQEEWRKQREADARREAEQERRERELQRERDFEVEIGRWRLARDIRAYAAEARELVESSGLEMCTDGRLDKQLRWALHYADRIDPWRALRAEVDGMRTQASSPGNADVASGESVETARNASPSASESKP